MNASIHWFEIPTIDLPRAVRFYEAMLATKLDHQSAGPRQVAIFPTQAPNGVTGCLVNDPGRYQPSVQGTIVYLGARGELDACIARARAAGGSVVAEKTAIPPNGAYALIRDTEGNVIGLHDA